MKLTNSKKYYEHAWSNLNRAQLKHKLYENLINNIQQIRRGSSWNPNQMIG